MKASLYLRVTAQRSNFCSDKSNSNYFNAVDLKVSKNKPDTNANELAIKLDLDIPNSLFMKPSLNFKMSIPEGAASFPVMEANVTDNLAQLLADELGQKVHLTVSDGEE